MWRGFTLTQWLVCLVAAIGFAFDTYEILVAPLMVRPALIEMGGLEPGTPIFNTWVSILFWVPSLVGGLFGLFGGYLTDLFGRRRVLTYSILLYAFSAVAAGYAKSPEMLLVFRVTTFIGVCVEFVAAVAWLAELFPDPRQRQSVLGYTQAFASSGGVLVSAVYYLCVTYSSFLPEIHGEHQPWRYLLISGLIPAFPLIVIRPFLPESPEWQRKRQEGTLRRPSITALFQPRFRRTTIVATILLASGYGAATGVIQQFPRVVPGLSDIANLSRLEQEQAVSQVQFAQEMGGVAGRLVLAFLAVRIVSRRKLLRIFQVPGVMIVPIVMLLVPNFGVAAAAAGIFVAGVLCIGQLSLFGNYLPLIFPLHLRGTGEGMAANVGGRMIGTLFAAITPQLSNVMPGIPSTQLAYAAGVVAFVVFAIGLTASRWMPEPDPKLLEE